MATEFVQVKLPDSDAIGTVPRDSLDHWKSKGYEEVSDETAGDAGTSVEEKPAGSTTGAPEGDNGTAASSAEDTTSSSSTPAARGGRSR